MPGRPSKAKPQRGSGIDPATGEWRPEFPGQRRPFTAGHTLTLKHGGRAVVALQPRALEIAENLRDLVPGYEPAYAPVLGLLGLSLARVENVSRVLAEMGEGEGEPPGADRLRHELRSQTRLARDLLADLGLTPRSRAALARDVAGARHTDALRDHLAAHYPAVLDAG